jgi:hypothetical protein
LGFLDLTFVASAAIVAPVTVGAQPIRKAAVEPRRSFLREIVAGLKYIAASPVLSYNIYGNLLVNFGVGAFNSMLVVYAYSHLHTNNFGYTVLEIAQLVGLSLAGLGMTFVLKGYSKGLLLAGGNLLLGLVITGFALTKSLAVAAVLGFVAGCVNLMSNTVSRTMIMENVSRENRGKVVNVRVALGRPVNTLGATLAGLLADTVRIPIPLVVALSGVFIALSGFIAFSLPSVIQYKVPNSTAQS